MNSSTSARLARVLLAFPEISDCLNLEDLNRFCDIVRWLREEISVVQRYYLVDAPHNLPANIHNFLMQVFEIPDEMTKLVWYALRDIAWEISDMDLGEIERRAQAVISLFLRYGLQNDIAFYNLWPPTRVCQDPACTTVKNGRATPHELSQPYIYTGTVFTRDIGAVPARIISLYCEKCHTRYYPTHYVHSEASKQTYYPGVVPSLVHFSKRSFISKEVCEMFANLMMTAWTSATNCARFYNLSLIKAHIVADLPTEWQSPFELDTENVWESFFLYSLLLDHHARGTILELPHQEASQADRLRPALHARNLLMSGPGQEHWSHCCDLCTWRYVQDGVPCGLRSAVTDGVGIGHPCCAVHDCKEPLLTKPKGARYCATHSAMEYKCSVVSCVDAAEEGFKTCALATHRALDDFLALQNKAMFQLRDRLERLSTVQNSHSLISTVASLPPESLDAVANLPHAHQDLTSSDAGDPLTTSLGDPDAILHAEEVECDVKSPEGNKRIRAQFGRRRTHNEETCVASCGVILGRATMFGSEAVSGVLEFWKRLFPTQVSLPGVLWHDQNCRLWSMLQNEDEDTRAYFQHVALPVDVFHFKCKHKETDVVCGTHCNPYIWPELRTEDGKWRFNSSAAEQSNVWFGKYQPMVREMHVDRFNFFMDEMVRRRNCMVVKELERKGCRPFIVPREAWL